MGKCRVHYRVLEWSLIVFIIVKIRFQRHAVQVQVCARQSDLAVVPIEGKLLEVHEATDSEDGFVVPSVAKKFLGILI